eukprot:scaffold1.g5646.t1
MRAFSSLLVCLLAAQAFHAVLASDPTFVDTNTVQSTDAAGDGNLVGDVTTLSCECGYLSKLYVQYDDVDTKEVRDVVIECADDSNPSTTTKYPAATNVSAYTAVVLSGSTATATTAANGFGYYRVEIGTSSADSITDLGSGTDWLACSSDATELIGLTIDVNSSVPGEPRVQAITGSCVAPADFKCQHGQTVASTCEAANGYYYDAQTDSCQQCGKGYYLDSTASHGTDATDLGTDYNCYPCPQGTYSNTVGIYQVGSCLACNNNDEYGPEEGADTCQKVPLGAQRTSDSTISYCPAGKVGLTGSDRSTCVYCPSGYWRPGGLATPTNNACLRIPAGWFATSGPTGASGVSMCPPGTASYWTMDGTAPETTATVALSVTTADPTAAVWSPAIDRVRVPATQTQCTACVADTFATASGVSDCARCKAGFEPSTQTFTAVGTGWGGTIATTLVNGYASVKDYASGTETLQTGCSACASRYYKDLTSSSSSCSPCLAGSETGVSEGAATCTTCPAGHINPVKGETVDTTHTVSVTIEGVTKVLSYANVTYYGIVSGTVLTWPGDVADTADATRGRATSCMPCPKGTMQEDTGAAAHTQCLACPAGYGTDTEGSTSCDPCPIGSYSPDSQTNCKLAEPGYYVPTEAATSATGCPYGTFAKTAGHHACDNAGTYAPNAGSKSCKMCPAGTYSKPGARACTPCSLGKFASRSGTAACVSAAKGYFVEKAGMKSQTPCPAGTYADATGLSKCKKCAANYYQPLTGKTACIACCPVANSFGNTCFLWTSGQLGAKQCLNSRGASRRMA